MSTEEQAAGLNAPMAEKCVLGVMMRENEIIPDLRLILKQEHFYSQPHGLIYRGICDLADRGPVDLCTVVNLLGGSKNIDDIGGYSYLAELWDHFGICGNVLEYARSIRDLAVKRGLFYSVQDIGTLATTAGTSAQEAISHAESTLAKLSQQLEAGTSSVTTFKDALNETMTWVDARKNNPGDDGTKTGLIDLDKATGGLHDGELVIIAGRPSQGKTALAGCLAANAARDGLPVFFASLEMSRIELCVRFLCSDGKIAADAPRKGTLSAAEIDKLILARDRIYERPIYIDDTGLQSITRISAQAKRLKKAHGIRLVVVDYLQLIQMDHHHGQNKAEQIGEVTRELKLLAKELRIPVVCLCQLNRQKEHREGAPVLSDLRGSGDIEQDADTVLMLWDGGAKDGHGPTHVEIAKQRNGPTGTIKLSFARWCVRFENHAEMPY